MIFTEDIPESGLIIVVVLFKGYKGNYQNDSRKSLLNTIPNHVKKKCGIDLKPFQFSLIRSVEEIRDTSSKKNIERPRTIGTEYKYRFENVTKEKFKEVFEEIRDYCNQRNIWSDYSIMFADYVGEINE